MWLNLDKFIFIYIISIYNLHYLNNTNNLKNINFKYRSLIGIYFGLKKIIKKEMFNRDLLIPFGLVTLFLIWIANLGLGELKYEPAYYLQKIRWAQQFPLITGLGNLFSHFGLDSGHFLQLALLDSIPFISRSFWNFSGYLLGLGFIYFFVMPLLCILKDKHPPYASDIMKLLFTPILIHNCFYMHPGLGTDLPVFILGSILAVEMFRILFEGEESLDIVLICIFLGIISKISFLPTAALAIIVILVIYFRNIDTVFRKYKLKMLFFILAFSLQIHRNIILTGYPLYPLEHISIPTQWKMDRNEVHNLSQDISRWAKGIRLETTPDEIEKIKKEWIKSRFLIQHRRVETLYPIILAIIGSVFVIFSKRISLRKLGIYILPALGQVGMWYFQSPDTRFASFAFWWLGAGLICFAVKDLFSRRLLILLPAVVLLFSFSLHTIDSLGSEKDLIVLEQSENVPTVPTYFIYKTELGLELLVPENGKKCDDCPLPCTQDPRPYIKLGKPGLIESGFYIK